MYGIPLCVCVYVSWSYIRRTVWTLSDGAVESWSYFGLRVGWFGLVGSGGSCD